MSNHNPHPNDASHHGKPVDEFKKDELHGTEVTGGGKGTVILPTADDPGSGIAEDGTATEDLTMDGNSDDSII